MAEISQAQVEQAIQTTCATVLKNELYFSDLDGLAGDGDFGTSLATGFRVIDISGSLATRGHFFGATSRNLLILAEKRGEDS